MIVSTFHEITSFIRPILKLHCFLRYAAGSNVDDIRIIAGISKPSFYGVMQEVVDAINNSQDLSYSWPVNDSDSLCDIARDFESKSTDGVLKGCV